MPYRGLASLARASAAALSFVCVTGMLRHADATEIPIRADKLTIYDYTPTTGRVRIGFTARDRYSGITKGAGVDPDAISASLRLTWSGQDGGFTVPAGAPAGNGQGGWIRNDPRSARYVNRNAAAGDPTGVARFVVVDGRSLGLVARTSGDATINLIGNPPRHGLQAEVTIENGAETIRHCTAFLPADVEITNVRGGARRLLARNGIPFACATESQPLGPTPVLPALPAAPYLWFDGTDPGALADLADRTSHPDTASLYNSVRAAVNGALASLGSASDDTRASVAKGAGLLHVLGETPPGGSGYSTYAAVVVAAITGIEPRNALDSIDEFLNPPADALDVLRDAGRLQSMAEAYDLIRGAGVDPLDDAAMRDRIANWADAYRNDWNLVGDSFGLFQGHRDNWGIKAGSALITTALALPDHTQAADWLAQGVALVSESLDEVVRSPGWYAESAHYLNYSLNNLVSAAWHLRNAAGVDWFDDLEPFVDMAFALRQPDGREPPFEEGVAVTFPWDVLAGAYPDRAARMQWALESSPRDFGAFENQQNHNATRFFVRPLDLVASAPTDAPTRFIDGDTHAVVLRSDWSSDAVQITGLTAIDSSSSELVSSRHHMENPLDVVLHGAGALLMPTASGGPQVTTSPNRNYYLAPGAKNVPLVDGNAPYVLEPLVVTLHDLLDSQDTAGLPHHFLDTATTRVAPFSDGVDVERTLALVDDSYGVVVDRFVSTAPHTFAVTWRGRGEAGLLHSSEDHAAVEYAWPDGITPSAHLGVDTVASHPLSGNLIAGFYAPSFGVEESLQPLRVSSVATEATFLSVLRPRTDGDSAAVSTPLTVDNGAAMSLAHDSTVDILVAGSEGATRSAGGVSSDGRLGVVRRAAGTVTGVAGIRTRKIEVDGGFGIRATAPITFAATFTATSMVLTIGGELQAPIRLFVSSPPGLANVDDAEATFDGVPLERSAARKSGSNYRFKIDRPGVLIVAAP